MELSGARLIDLPVIPDVRGKLSFLQHPDHLPFIIRRTFWIYDVPGDGVRGGHAYHRQVELIIALSGSFRVTVDNGYQETDYYLRRPDKGLLIPALTWRSMHDFSTNSLSLHLSDSRYDASDYIRDYETYKENIK